MPDDDDDAAEFDVDDLVEASDETRDVEPAAAHPVLVEPKPTVVATSRPAPLPVQDALAAVSIERTPDGGIRIDAPPEAADTLAGLFEGLARMLSPVIERGSSGDRANRSPRSRTAKHTDRRPDDAD